MTEKPDREKIAAQITEAKEDLINMVNQQTDLAVKRYAEQAAEMAASSESAVISVYKVIIAHRWHEERSAALTKSAENLIKAVNVMADKATKDPSPANLAEWARTRMLVAAAITITSANLKNGEKA